MIWLVLGVALWWAAHFFKRLAPRARARMGERGKGAVALALVVSIVLMVIGYRMADGTVYWSRTPALTGINNLLVLLAFYLFAASGAKTWITRHLRHPQLTAFGLWAGAHLLVNGDTESLVLFGGLLAWAVAEIVTLNRIEGPWTRPAHPLPVRKEITSAVAALVLFVVVALIHGWIGPRPFG
ncbi:NnrU family protein [Oceanicola granulosus HTCC2516]|uniref:NnrU family protein n=1 Tax=Oceanicola granulosus (strain ATCC BAA-861 / DSM 15982 / KCTC 12143 / HTCC2516) TaxID=314256 RepID=Q2CI37_OCEGH|nr:NnrU family protein [Oceanicola granulosus]EAR52421.1 NnrU family protein [Oceanicola granulosus HTCC2516]